MIDDHKIIVHGHRRTNKGLSSYLNLAQLIHTTHGPAGVGMLAAIATRPPTADTVTCRLHDLVTHGLQ